MANLINTIRGMNQVLEEGTIRGKDGKEYKVEPQMSGNKIQFKVTDVRAKQFKTISLGQAAKLFEEEDLDALSESHFKAGDKVIWKGMEGEVISSKGEGDDEVYTVKCEDGETYQIPARELEGFSEDVMDYVNKAADWANKNPVVKKVVDVANKVGQAVASVADPSVADKKLKEGFFDYKSLAKDVAKKFGKKGKAKDIAKWVKDNSDDDYKFNMGDLSSELKKMGFRVEEVEVVVERTFTDKEIKMAYGILNDPRYKQGNLTGAVKAIEKIARGLSAHPSVKKAMRATQESLGEAALNIPKSNMPKTLKQMVSDYIDKTSDDKLVRLAKVLGKNITIKGNRVIIEETEIDLDEEINMKIKTVEEAKRFGLTQSLLDAVKTVIGAELDPVNDKENDKKFKDRKDKDIDNDGDVDSSDEYLHKRRAATDDAIDGGKKPAEESDIGQGKKATDAPPKVSSKGKEGKGISSDEMTAAAAQIAKSKMKSEGDDENDRDININIDNDGNDEKEPKKDVKKKSDEKDVDAKKAEMSKDTDGDDEMSDEEKAKEKEYIAKKSNKKEPVDTKPVMKEDLDAAVRRVVFGIKETELDESVEIKEAYGPSTKGYIKQVKKSSYKGYLKRKHAAEVEKGGEPNPGKWSHPKNEEASNCKTMKEEEMTDAQMKKREEIVKSMKKKEDEFKAKYGDRWKDVMYATATKMAMKEGASWTKKEDFASDYAAQAKSQAVFGKSTPEIDITQKAAKAAVNTVKGVLSKIKGKPAPNDSANSKGGDTSVAP